MADIDGPSSTARSSTGDQLQVDARRLRGLAHPIRVQILDLLELGGPATATGLAERLGVKTGTTSWHLAKLAEHDFVVEDVDRGNRRDRWWRVAAPSWSISNAEFVDDPELADASDVLLSTVLSQQLMRATQFVHEDWSKRWRDVWLLTTDKTLRLDPDGLAALRTELWAVIEKYRDRPSDAPDAERVIVQLQGFPHRSAP